MAAVMVATTVGGTRPSEEFPPLLPNTQNPQTMDLALASFASPLKPKVCQPTMVTVPIKPIIVLHGEPNITWKSLEVRSLIVKENLQYTIIGKFSYGRPDIKELRKQILGQCGVKSE